VTILWQIVANCGILKTNKFYCELCDYKCFKKYNWEKHILSLKHKKYSDGNIEQQKVAKSGNKLSNISLIYTCEFCEKIYESRNGLWKHKKKCNISTIEDMCNEELSDKELMVMIVKQNSQLLDVIKNWTHNTISSNNNNSNNNSNNKTFNLQFFLNETCKDAINISDFVNSIKPQLADLENTGRVGYVEGISNIILNNLNNLNNHERPLHCSDQKREVIYIKDNNEWIKENDDKPILTKAIKVIANENIKNIGEWRNLNPDCTDSDSMKNNLYLKIVSNAMSGSTAEESSKNINKIISNVAKEVIIDKHI
jgi:hypothetical protein